jgi:hypothetical protein
MIKDAEAFYAMNAVSESLELPSTKGVSKLKGQSAPSCVFDLLTLFLMQR